MESCDSLLKSQHFFCSSRAFPPTKSSSKSAGCRHDCGGGRSERFLQSRRITMSNHRTTFPAKLAMKKECGKGVISGVAEKTEIMNEMKVEEEEEWLRGIGGLNGVKEMCRGADGKAELLECLEREAIMGDDEGRDPTDYNRRALIFDRSSKVFQALKHTQLSSDSSDS